MHRTPLRLLAVLLALALTLLACGGDDDDGADVAADETTTTEDTPSTTEEEVEDEPAEGGEVCEVAQRLADLDDESQGVVNESLSEILSQSAAGDQAAADAALDDALDQIRAFIDERLPELVGAYDDLERTVPEDLAPDVATIRDFTVEFVQAIADVHTVAELEALISERQESINAVAEAVFRLDEFTREECGIVLAD